MFSCLLTAVLIMVDFTETAWWCILPLISLGVAYSIYASALWTAIPFVTTPECYGTAFGLVTTIQQIGLTVVPMLVSLTLKDSFWHQGYAYE
jgi:hypothetical protein